MIANRVDPETGKAAKLGNSELRLSRWAEGYEREQGRTRVEKRVKNNERRREGEEVRRPIWDRGALPPEGHAARAGAAGDEERVDMTAWRLAEARLCGQVEDRCWLGFWRLESRTRKEWAELHKLQEDMRQRLDRESRTVLGRLRL